MKKLTVAVIFGSRSTEHDVSVVTAIGSVVKPLELTGKYEVVPVYIAKDGRWYSDAKLKDISLFSSGKVEAFLKSQPPVAVLFDDGLTLVKGTGLRTKKLQIDVAFPATHGTHGEDGELMGLLEMANLPYVGCDMPASVIAMDKVLAKLVALAHALQTAKFQYFSKLDYEANTGRWLQKINKDPKHRLQYPLFVKPAHLGSSIGITRVTDPKELANAIEVALHYDDKALVEEAVPNLIEVTLPIMGNEKPQPALLEEPLLKSEDFFSFETKYMQGGKKGGGKAGGKQGAQGYSRLPADLPKDVYKQAEEMGLAVYRALGCSGTARVDMLIDTKTKQVYFNEVNPLPGSLYAHNWRKAGVSTVELVAKLIALAEARHAKKQVLATTFSSSYLKQF